MQDQDHAVRGHAVRDHAVQIQLHVMVKMQDHIHTMRSHAVQDQGHAVQVLHVMQDDAVRSHAVRN